MPCRMWRLDSSLLVVALVLEFTSKALCQSDLGAGTSFSSLLADGSVVQLNTSAKVGLAKASVNGSFAIKGRSGVWISLPSELGVVRLERGSRLQLVDMGISYKVPGTLDLPSLLTPSFFDVDQAAVLELRNVSINTDCDTLYALQSYVCGRMPDENFEVALWAVRIVNLVTPTLLAENATLRCGVSASNSTVTVTYMGGDTMNSNTPNELSVTSDMNFPCVSSLVKTYADFLAVLSPYPNAQPQAFYPLIVNNITADLSIRTKIVASKSNVSVVITGRRNTPTQFDLGGLAGIISVSNSKVVKFEFRDITLTNLYYGPSNQNPWAFLTAALWFLDYRRADSIYSLSVTQVNLTRVTLVVSDSELRWWGAMVNMTLRANATGVDQGILIRYSAPGLQVVPDDGRIWIPYWEWAYGMTTWTNCTMTTTPLVPSRISPPLSPGILDTLLAYGQSSPVPLSKIQLVREQLSESVLSSASNVVLLDNVQLPTSLLASRPTLGANMTIWGAMSEVRYVDMQGLSGIITVPPYTVLTVRYVTIFNLAVGRGGVQPAPLQNYTLMLWTFNRALQQLASNQPRRALLSAGVSEDGTAARDASKRLALRGHWRRSEGLQPRVAELHNETKALNQISVEQLHGHLGRNEGGHWRRRQLMQATGSSDSDNSSSNSIGGGKIPVGPFQTWLRLEDVVLHMPEVEVKLIYDILAHNTTSLRVSPDAVDWIRVVLATAKVTRVDSSFLHFASLNWMGIEAVNVMLYASQSALLPYPVLQPTGSILLSGMPPSHPPPSLRLPSPSVALMPPVSASAPSDQQYPTSAAGVAAAPGTHAGSIIGPAVGSAAGLLLLCGLVAATVMFVRHRKRTPGPSQAKSLGPEVDDTSNAESGPRSTDLAVDGNNSKQLLPPPSPHEYVGPAIPAEAGRFSHTGKGTAPREIQSATQSGDTAAAAAAAANGKGSGKPPLGQPPCPPGHNRSQEANRLRTSRGSRLAKAENCTGANTASGKQPPPQSQPRKSQSSGSASSSSKGAGSDAVQINPRTELYAALAAFQSELGEQQQVTIISQLGAGAHGVVYRGEWRGLEVAIKTLFFQAFVGGNTDDSGNSLKEQAILEAAIATTLFHPNVINTFSYDIKPLRMCPAPASSTTSSRAETLVSSEGGSVMDWKLYIIQEYCDGGTLKDALDGARFTDPDTGMAYKETAVRVAIEIALGMSYIHGRNIIHGDLKPANILLRSNGASPYGYTAKIADFGLALKLKAGESHISNIRRGTPLYIASELVEDGRATTASDLYSFGVILWELLHGCTVARRLPLRRRIPNLPMEFYTWPPDCPPAYRELATACLSSNPASRPRFVDALPILNTLLSLLVDARLQEQQLRHQQQEERRRLPVKAAARVTAQECKREDEGQGQAQAASSGAHSGDKEGTLAEPDGVGCAGGAASGLSLDFQVEGTQQPNNPHPSCKQLPSFAGAAPSNPTSIEIPDCAVYKQSSRATTKNLDADNGVITGKGLEPVASAAIAAAGRGQASLGAKAMVATGARDVAAACVDMQVEPTHAGNVPRSTFAGQDNVDAAAGRDRPDKGDCADARSGNAEVAAAAPEVGASYGSHTGTGSQTEGYAPVGDARPMALRALVHTASAEVETVAEAEAVKLAACRDASMHGGGNAGGVSPSPGGGTISLDDKAQSGQPILGGQQQPSSPGLVEIRVPPNPNGVAVGLTAVCIEPSPAVADSDVHMHAGKAVEHSNPITDNAHANQHANLLTSKHASRQEWRNTTVFPTTVAAATAFLAAQPAAETPVPTTAAATAAVLAALAGSITNTRTLDNDIGGMLDSCLGSTDGRAMERGLMLDLMPALSNQPHSSHISSSLSPDLAVALEKMLGMHGIRRDAAPVLEPADMATSGTETCESGGRLAVLGRQG